MPLRTDRSVTKCSWTVSRPAAPAAGSPAVHLCEAPPAGVQAMLSSESMPSRTAEAPLLFPTSGAAGAGRGHNSVSGLGRCMDRAHGGAGSVPLKCSDLADGGSRACGPSG
eukprot:278782-Chlamydomonas_euryale.AAC.6